MNWHLIFSVIAVGCLFAAALGFNVKRVTLGWAGLAIWAALSLF